MTRDMRVTINAARSGGRSLAGRCCVVTGVTVLTLCDRGTIPDDTVLDMELVTTPRFRGINGYSVVLFMDQAAVQDTCVVTLWILMW